MADKPDTCPEINTQREKTADYCRDTEIGRTYLLAAKRTNRGHGVNGGCCEPVPQRVVPV